MRRGSRLFPFLILIAAVGYALLVYVLGFLHALGERR